MSEPTITPDGGAPTGLPSDVTPTAIAETFGTTTAEDFSGDKGLYKGRWNSPQEMSEYIQNLETKHANVNRDISNADKANTAAIEAAATASALEQSQNDTLMELAPAFMANEMQVDDAMLAKLKEVGLDERDIKLGAYELRERVEGYHKVVGSKEQYDNMMGWAVSGLDDAAKVDFNNGLKSANSALVIEGLNTRYLKALEAGTTPEPQDRLRGTPSGHSAVKPYGSRAELFADKAFADSNRANPNDKAKYRARLAATPDSVWK